MKLEHTSNHTIIVLFSKVFWCRRDNLPNIYMARHIAPRDKIAEYSIWKSHAIMQPCLVYNRFKPCLEQSYMVYIPCSGLRPKTYILFSHHVSIYGIWETGQSAIVYFIIIQESFIISAQLTPRAGIFYYKTKTKCYSLFLISYYCFHDFLK